LEIKREDFLDLIEKRPQMGVKILRRMADNCPLHCPEQGSLEIWPMRRFILFPLITLSILGCAVTQGSYKRPTRVLPEEYKPYTVNGARYYPLPGREGFVQEGMASWYGKEFHQKQTASGEIFNMYHKTAAHKTLPFGTHVMVKNLSNLREVVVRINDRGPFVKGRIIDLSYGAAKEIGLIDPGVTNIRLVGLSKEVGTVKLGSTYRPLVEVRDFGKGIFTVQVGAFEIEDNARHLAERLRVIFDDVTITPHTLCDGKTLYRVRVTASKGLPEASRIVKKLESLGFSDTFVVGL
jgi:rare lipoprotein A